MIKKFRFYFDVYATDKREAMRSYEEELTYYYNERLMNIEEIKLTQNEIKKYYKEEK